MRFLRVAFVVILLGIISGFMSGCIGGSSSSGTTANPLGANSNPSILDVSSLQTTIASNSLNWTAGNTGVIQKIQPSDLHILLGASVQDFKGSSDVTSNKENIQPEILHATLPSSFSWQPYCTSVKDQGQFGTCVAFACCSCIESELRINQFTPLGLAGPQADLSEYYLWSIGNKDVNPNPGRWYIDKAAEMLKKSGTIEEQFCPYSQISGWPTYSVLTSSPNPFKIKDYQWINGFANMKQALINGPLVSTMVVYTDFFTYKSGVYKPLPVGTYLSWKDIQNGNYFQKIEGYHAILLVGYDDNENCWLIKNSWDTDWG